MMTLDHESKGYEVGYDEAGNVSIIEGDAPALI